MTEPHSVIDEYVLYVDDSGDPKPNPFGVVKYFAMGGVLIRSKDDHLIESAVNLFKARWEIDSAVPLHATEIRSKKKNFKHLGARGDTYYAEFLKSLSQMIVSLPILVHACVVHRANYLDRYSVRYGILTWEMKKSVFQILIERAGRFAEAEGKRLSIVVESIGPKEDTDLTSYFNDYRANGHSFDKDRASKYMPPAPGALQRTLKEIDFKGKENAGLQLADLVLNPVAAHRFQEANVAFSIMEQAGVLIDSKLSGKELQHLGIKYFCF